MTTKPLSTEYTYQTRGKMKLSKDQWKARALRAEKANKRIRRIVASLRWFPEPTMVGGCWAIWPPDYRKLKREMDNDDT